MRVASVIPKKDQIYVSLFFLFLGWMLANGFSGTAFAFAKYFSEFISPFYSIPLSNEMISAIGLLGLSSLFYFSTFSLPSENLSTNWCPAPSLAMPLALSLAFLYGLAINPGASSLITLQDALWLLIVIPISEEFLFRGWIWKISSRFAKAEFFSFTCPLPCRVVWTSLSFSLWHLQNLSHFAASIVVFQMCYTFFTSVWLCRLRQNPWGMAYCTATHSMLNAMTLMGQWIL